MALLVAASLLTGTTAGAQQDPPKIVDIIVIGNKIQNRESILASSGLQVGQSLTQEALDNAKRRLLSLGTFGAGQTDTESGVKITAEVRPEGAKVVIEVVENEIVKGFEIVGSGPIPATEIQAKLMPMKDQILSLPVLQRKVGEIRQMYEDKGYQGFVSEELAMRNGILYVPIVVGKISELKISGLNKTKGFVVTREMKLKQGEYYNVEQLKKDLTRVLNTDLFEGVEPAFQFPRPGEVTINLNVQEKRTGTVEAAIGYGSRGLIGRIGVGETNFLGRGQQVNVLWETGGLANRNSFEVHFTEPWLDKRHTSLSLSLFDKAVYRFTQRIGSFEPGDPVGDSSDYYYETHRGGQITVSRPFSESYRGYVGFRHDNVSVPNLNLGEIDRRILQNGALSGINLRLTHNTRDFDLEPATGGFETYTLDLGRADLKPVGGETEPGDEGVFGVLNYTRYGVDARRYFSPQGKRVNPKDRRTVIAFRLMGGASNGTLPFSEQWFMGGAESLRGYQEDRFWGTNMLLFSGEYRHPLAQSLTGVLFADLGDAWGGPYKDVNILDFEQHSNFKPSLGIGLGLRVITPIGPIRIDQGFGKEGTRTHFSIGHVF